MTISIEGFRAQVRAALRTGSDTERFDAVDSLFLEPAAARALLEDLLLLLGHNEAVEDKVLRATAARVLAATALAEQEVYARLATEFTEAPDPIYRAALAHALGLMGEHAGDAAPLLAAQLSVEAAEEARCRIIEALGRSRHLQSRTLIEAFRADESDRVRAAAEAALRKLERAV